MRRDRYRVDYVEIPDEVAAETLIARFSDVLNGNADEGYELSDYFDMGNCVILIFEAD